MMTPHTAALADYDRRLRLSRGDKTAQRSAVISLPHPSEPKPKASYPAVWLADAKPSFPPAIVKGLFGPGNFVLVFGESDSGKTFFTVSLVTHIALGQKWRGRKVRQCFVVYIAFEAGETILARFAVARDKLVGEGYSDPMPLQILTAGPNLLNLVDVENLIEQLREAQAKAEMPLGVVVIDTVSRSIAGGDENGADMTMVVAFNDRVRTEFGAACIAVHHSGKDRTKGSRGHSSLAAAADVILEVHDKVATVKRVRDGIGGTVFPFDLDVVDIGTDEDGEERTTCVVNPIDEAPRSRRTPKSLSGPATAGLRAMQQAIDAHGQTLPETSTLPRGVRACTLLEWRAQFRVCYGLDGDGAERDADTVKKAFQRTKAELLKEQYIGISDPYCWATQ
jgi:KaiC/GvpD/RAD55 family RecA-like ATPase